MSFDWLELWFRSAVSLLSIECTKEKLILPTPRDQSMMTLTVCLSRLWRKPVQLCTGKHWETSQWTFLLFFFSQCTVYQGRRIRYGRYSPGVQPWPDQNFPHSVQINHILFKNNKHYCFNWMTVPNTKSFRRPCLFDVFIYIFRRLISCRELWSHGNTSVDQDSPFRFW